MTLGRISYENTYGENVLRAARYDYQDDYYERNHTGMDFTAQFLDGNEISTVTFHFNHWTNNFRGQVERVLSRYFKAKEQGVEPEYPADISNVVVD